MTPHDPAGSWPSRHKRWSSVLALVAVGVVGSAISHADSSDRSFPSSTASSTTSATESVALQPSPHSVTPPAATTLPVATTAVATTAVGTPPSGEGVTAVEVLGRLRVAGRSAKTGYDRMAFGPAWTDTNRNGCDTRNDVLRRDLILIVVKAGTQGCKLLAGTLRTDPYTGVAIAFVYGGASEVDVDHVVALSDAWQTGGSSWVFKKRLAFANDPMNLLLVDASANRQKGDGDAATWLPPNKPYRCRYVARQVAVKAKYRLWVTAAERAAVERVLRTCASEPVPRGSAPTIAPVAGIAPPPRTSPPRPSARSSSSTSGASARCVDGTLSYSAHRRGTCSHHGGVAQWLRDLPA